MSYRHGHSAGRLALLAAGAALAATPLTAVVTAQAATTGCAVDYRVTSQWPGGYQADVHLRNTGDPWTSWTLTFAFPDGQTVTQGWGGRWTTAGSGVTVVGESWNGPVPAGGEVGIGFIGSWDNVSNRVPTSFAVNGTTCGDGTTTTTTTTTIPRTTTTTTGTTTTTTTGTTTTTTGTTTGTTTTSGQPDGPRIDPALLARCSGTSPISCSFDVAPGNYEVAAVLGDPARAASTSVQAEARRQLLAAVSTTAGQLATVHFTVNVRQPEGQPTSQGGAGRSGLQLSFGGSAPRLNGIGLAAAPTAPVLYLAGDSTVCDQQVAPYTGWGQELPQYIADGLAVANYADSGESSGSFLANSALFPAIRSRLTSRDTVFIQFGHNDKTTSASSFTANLTSMVSQVKAKGASPVLVTPPVRRLFDSSGRLTGTARHINSLGVDLPAVMRQVAAQQGVPLIDLTASSRTLVEQLGSSGSAKIYLTTANDGVSDNTHFSAYGANEMSKLVVQAVRSLSLPIATHLR